MLKREVEVLERRLAGLTAGPAGSAAEGGEAALAHARAGGAAGAAGLGGGGMALSTSARIARDREVHRLRLKAVEGVPKDVLVELMQVRNIFLCENMRNAVRQLRYTSESSANHLVLLVACIT